MNPSLPELAAEFGAAATKAFEDLGGVDCARRAESDPELRRTKVSAVLEDLGAGDLDPRADLDTAAAAGELCRVAGRCVLPYPVAGYLMRDPLPLALGLRVDHGDLFNAWCTTAFDGTVKEASPAGQSLASKLGPFVTDLSPTRDLEPFPLLDRALLVSLSAWRVLGCCERALELAVDHVSNRVQFGQPLSRFQAVQFQLADASVALDGLREMCRYTLWRVFVEPSVADMLALRMHASDTARSVLRTTQQLHGAAGVCDEYDISVLCRHIQPELRLPFGSEHTASLFFDAVEREGYEALFPQGNAAR